MLFNSKKLLSVISIIIIMFSLCSVFSSCSSDKNARESTIGETKQVTKKSLYFANKTDIKFTSSISEKRIYLYSADSDIADIKDDLEFISENENVASIEYDNNSQITGCVKITKKSAGETTIYVRNNKTGAQTDKIKIIVEGETTTEQQTVPTPTAETTTKSTEPEKTTAKQNNNYQANNDDNENNNGQIVYITPSGKKYHYKKSCAGKNAMERDINSVKGSYGPCKKCVK